MATKNLQRSIIPFGKGMHRSPSTPQEGELSECVNLWPRGEELTGLPQPVSTGISFESNKKKESLACIHMVPTEKHYISIMDNWGVRRPNMSFEFKVVMQQFWLLQLYCNYSFQGRELTLTLTFDNGAKEVLPVTMTGNVARVRSKNYMRSHVVTGAEIAGIGSKWDTVSIEVVDSRQEPYVYSGSPTRIAHYSLMWFTEVDMERQEILSDSSRILQVLPFGNMLVVKFEDEVRYLLWKDGKYINLGGAIPEIDAQVALDGEFYIDQGSTIVKMVTAGSIADYSTLHFTISDPAAPAYWNSMDGSYKGKKKTLAAKETLQRGKTYRFFNYSKYDVYIRLDVSAQFAYEYVLRKNAYKDIKIPMNTSALYYRSNASHSNGETFFCNVKVYANSVDGKTGIAPDNTSDNLQAIMGAANKFLSDAMKDAGKFVLPFFARVGLRLFDSSITHLSCPALLTPNSGCAPYFLVQGSNAGEYPSNVFGCRCRLQFYLSDTDVQNLNAWKDLIQSVVVAVTPAIYRYNEGYTFDKDKTKLESNTIYIDREYASGLTDDPFTASKIASLGQAMTYEVSNEASSAGGWYDSSVMLDLSKGDVLTHGSSEPGDIIIFKKEANGNIVRKDYISTAESKRTYTVEEDGTYCVGGEDMYGNLSKGSFYVTKAQYAGYLKQPIGGLLARSGEFKSDGAYLMQIALPRFDDKTTRSNIVEQSNFHVIGEYPIEEIKAGWTTVDTESKDLFSIPSLERVEDDNHSHNKLAASVLFSYNSKLHLADVTERVWGGSVLELMTGYAEDRGRNEEADIWTHAARVVVSLVKNGRAVYADSGWGDEIAGLDVAWLFYPDADAREAVVYTRTPLGNGSYVYDKCKLPLTAHKFLEGAYWFNDYNSPAYESCTEEEATASVADNSLHLPNKLYVSETDNPVLFPTTQRISVGNGTILALATTAVAFSQNTYGRNAVQAFCTDGIWELEVADTGRYLCKNPTSRDALTNVSSVTMLDGSVAFVTASGLKMLSGQGVRSVGDELNGFNVSESNPDIQPAVQSIATEFSGTAPSVQDEKVFVERLQTARIAYDYPRNLLHVFIDGEKWHYVMDVKSGEWAMQTLPFSVASIVSDYPSMLMQGGDATLYGYEDVTSTQKQLEEHSIGYALTRPLSLDDPTARKMIYDLRTLAQKTSATSALRVAVFASNDSVNWYRLTSLKAFSAKWYRILVVTNFNELDALNGVVLQYVERFGDKMH